MPRLQALHPRHLGILAHGEHTHTVDWRAQRANAIDVTNPLESVFGGAKRGAGAIIAKQRSWSTRGIRRAVILEAGVIDQVVDVAEVGIGKAKVDRHLPIGVVTIGLHTRLAADR